METSVMYPIPLKDFVSLIETSVRKVLSEKNTKEDVLLNSKEVMELLRISTTTLQHWRDNKKIPFKREGNKIYYSKSDVLKKLQNHN